MKALLVDDEVNVRDVIRYLGQWDELGVTEILEADDGEEAQEIIERERPEIIFTDIRMPGMDGIQLIEWLSAAAYPGKVIILTGYDDYSYMRTAIRCGSYDYLLKPIRAETLNEVLERAIRDWKLEEDERRDRESGFMDEVRRLRINRMVTAACKGKGEPGYWEEAAACLPRAEMYDVTLMYFYQAYQSDTYIGRLAEELKAQGWGYAFTLQMDNSPGLILSVHGNLSSIEEWITHNFEIPLRLVSGDPIKSVKDLPASYQSVIKAADAQNFRTIHRLSKLQDEQRMKDIAAFLREHFTEEIDLEKLAARFFLSREHISRQFKKEYGMTVSSFVIQLRIEQAKRWLSETNETMSSISMKLGYLNEKYFPKLFKKIVGMTPLDYRTAMKKAIGNECSKQ